MLRLGSGKWVGWALLARYNYYYYNSYHFQRAIMEPVWPSHRAPCDWGAMMLTDFWSNPRQCTVLPIAALSEKACLPVHSPPPPSSSSTTTPQSTRCIVKKWEGTLEPSCSMKVGCSVCLLMRWKEDGSEKWNKVREHIKRRRKKRHQLSALRQGGERRGNAVATFFFFLWTSFEVQVRNWEKSRKRDGSLQHLCRYY